MSFSSNFYSKIKDIIATYGSTGTISHMAIGDNYYDDEGIQTAAATDFLVDYVSSTVKATEKTRFSNYFEMIKVTIINDGITQVRKGDNFTSSNGDVFSIEEVDKKGVTQDKDIILELYCVIV